MIRTIIIKSAFFQRTSLARIHCSAVGGVRVHVRVRVRGCPGLTVGGGLQRLPSHCGLGGALPQPSSAKAKLWETDSLTGSVFISFPVAPRSCPQGHTQLRPEWGGLAMPGRWAVVGSGKAREKADPGPECTQWSDTPAGLSVERTPQGCPGRGRWRSLQRRGRNTSNLGRALGPERSEERDTPASGLKASEGRALWGNLSHQAQGLDLREAGGCSPPSSDTLLSNSLKQCVHTDAASWRRKNTRDAHSPTGPTGSHARSNRGEWAHLGP